MSTSYQDYQDTVSQNTCHMYGYAQGRIKAVADGLGFGSMDRKEAERDLIALEKTMQRLFDERGEKGAYERIGEYFAEFRKGLPLVAGL